MQDIEERGCYMYKMAFSDLLKIILQVYVFTTILYSYGMYMFKLQAKQLM